MTKKNLITFLLIASYVATTFIVGCIPEDSLQWSADGSVGVLGVNGALYLVNGQTGELTEVVKDNIQPWPGISSDGNLIAYAEAVECESLSQAIKLLPAGQIKALENIVQAMEEKCLKQGLSNGKFPTLLEFVHKSSDGAEQTYRFKDKHIRNWVIRYLCENADSQLVKKLGTDIIDKGKTTKITYFRIIIAPRYDLDKKTVVTTSLLKIWQTRFSSDAKLIAYLVTIPSEEDSNIYDLFVAAPLQDVNAMHLASTVEAGFDWRANSRAIAYLQAESTASGSNFTPATLKETILVDDKGKLMAEPASPEEPPFIATHTCKGDTKELAGAVFIGWMKVRYGLGNRIFFSNSVMSMPSSKIDEDYYSLFCYDPLTGTVADVLPSSVAGFTGVHVPLFELSPDGTRVLLPAKKTTLALYRLGERSMNILIPEAEGYGDDNPNFIPAWKTDTQISCPVAKNSHYLTDDPNTPHRRKEIVILDAEGNLKKILSKDWPDELLEF